LCRYKNQNGTLDSFASFWRTVATTFENRSSVLGYELLNEPPFSELVDAVKIGHVDQVYLAPMYKKLHEVIRQVDDKHIIFFEPCVADLLQTGLTEGPGGVDYNNRQAFSYHVYCIDVTKQGDPKSDLVCDIDDALFISSRYEEARKKKFGGMMLTEFGAISNSTEGINEITRITALADEYLQSWSYWQFKKYQDLTTAASPATTESFYTEDGELEINKVRALSRSYAQAIAGIVIVNCF
jgi:endoglycosylceramidase